MPCKLGPRRRRVHPERQSHLDGDPVWSDITNAYRGFFTLFILCTIVDVLLPVVEHWERANVLLPVFNDREDGERRITSMWHAIAMRFLDWAVFVVSDMVMIAFTFSAVVVQRAVHGIQDVL